MLQYELEKELNNQLTSLQTAIGPEPPLKTSLLEDESGMIHELTQVTFPLNLCCAFEQRSLVEESHWLP